MHQNMFLDVIVLPLRHLTSGCVPLAEHLYKVLGPIAYHVVVALYLHCHYYFPCCLPHTMWQKEDLRVCCRVALEGRMATTVWRSCAAGTPSAVDSLTGTVVSTGGDFARANAVLGLLNILDTYHDI